MPTHEEALRELLDKKNRRDKKQSPSMKMHGRGMKRFAAPKKANRKR